MPKTNVELHKSTVFRGITIIITAVLICLGCMGSGQHTDNSVYTPSDGNRKRKNNVIVQ